MVVRDITLRSRLSKNIHLSCDFFHFRSLIIRKSAFVNIFWCDSDNQSTREPKSSRCLHYLLAANPILGSVILCGTFRRISQLWENPHTLNLGNRLLYILSFTISQFLWLYPMHGFWFYFLLRDTTHTLLKPKYPWRDQTSLVCYRTVPVKIGLSMNKTCGVLAIALRHCRVLISARKKREDGIMILPFSMPAYPIVCRLGLQKLIAIIGWVMSKRLRK